MLSLWEVLKTSKGLPAPDGFTALFARSLSDTYTLAEISGIPPLNLGEIVEIVDYTIEGNTYQSDGVSPDTPQEVVGVGERTANLYSWDGNLLGSSGLTVSENKSVISSVIDVRGIDTVYFTGDNTLLNSKVYRISKSDTPIEVGSTIKTFDSSFVGGAYDVSDCNYLLVAASVYSMPQENIELIKNTFMLNSGSTPLPYEPYGYKLDVECRGKNLVKISDDNYIIYSSYSGFTISNNSLTITGATLMGFKVEVEPNTTYSVSSVYSAIPTGTTVVMRIREYSAEPIDWESNFIIQSVNALNSATFTTSAETKYVLVAFYVSGQGAGMTISNIQLELGSTATSYEPYHEPITTQIYLDSPLYKIGDYADSIGMTEEVRVVKELVLTGEENWAFGSSSVYILDLPNVLNGSGITSCICTHYASVPNIEGGYSSLSDKCCSIRYNQLKLWVRDIAVGGLDNFKSYLAAQYAAGTPVTVYYVLAEPETKTVEPVKIPTLNGTTVIDIDTEVKPSNLKITYKSRR